MSSRYQAEVVSGRVALSRVGTRARPSLYQGELVLGLVDVDDDNTRN